MSSKLGIRTAFFAVGMQTQHSLTSRKCRVQFRPLVWKICSFLLRLACLSVLLSAGLGCYQCFVMHDDTFQLCESYRTTKDGRIDISGCEDKIKEIFDNNPMVINAGSVGKVHEKDMTELLFAEVKALKKDFTDSSFSSSFNPSGTEYERRLQIAANNFIAAAFKLPRDTGCIPPCGFQSGGAYNCVTCAYDSCLFPLDCPVKVMTVMENNRSQMWCDVLFPLPANIEIIWRFAEQVKTQQVDQFKEVTAGVDKLYAIPSTGVEHVGTYMCEIYSGSLSLVRVYFYISVTLLPIAGHIELQEIFDLSLLPGGRLLPESGAHAPPPPPHLLFPSPLLLVTCLTSLLLLLGLSLGILHWSQKPKEPEEPVVREETCMEMQEIESESESPEVE